METNFQQHHLIATWWLMLKCDNLYWFPGKSLPAPDIVNGLHAYSEINVMKDVYSLGSISSPTSS